MTPDDWARKTLLWLIFLAIGSVVGVWLGNMVSDFRPLTGANITPYAELSGNPDALSADSHPFTPCENCADSYGSARYANEQRARNYDDVYRALGRVAVDYPQSESHADDYRYGGGFSEMSPLEDAALLPDRHTSTDTTTPKRGETKRVVVQPLEAQPDAAPLDRNTTPLIY